MSPFEFPNKKRKMSPFLQKETEKGIDNLFMGVVDGRTTWFRRPAKGVHIFEDNYDFGELEYKRVRKTGEKGSY